MSVLKVSPAERAELRAQAHALKPVVLIGSEGLTEAVLNEIAIHLAAHQLIKIRVFGDERSARLAIYQQICDQLDAEPIQHIGKLLVIWKPLAPQRPVQTSRTRGLSALPSAREVAKKPGAGAPPRLVKIVKPTDHSTRREKPQKMLVRGNERVTMGGNIKRAKKRTVSVKRQHQTVK